MLKRMIALGMAIVMLLSCVNGALAVDVPSGATEITSSTTTLSTGSYQLTSDVTLTSSLQITGASTTVNLYLNGHTLTGNGVDPVIRVNSSGAVLNIYDNGTTEKEYNVPYSTAG